MRNTTDESITLSNVKVESIEEVNGRRVAIVEADKGTVRLIIPCKLSRYYDAALKSGVKITVEGKKLL